VREQVDIEALVPRRSLEEYFLSITESDAQEAKTTGQILNPKSEISNKS
jgi:hypothetical protein